MAMCKECGNVVGVNEVKNGFCSDCISGNQAVAVAAAEVPAESNIYEQVLMSDFKNPFYFSGRSGRSDYFVYGILVPILLSLLGVYAGFKLELIPVMLGFVLAGTVIGLAALVRRCRDREENVFVAILLIMIPYFGFLVPLYLLLAPGKRRKVAENENRDDQKVQNNNEENR